MPKNHILFVDDDPNLQEFSRIILASAGFSVTVAGTAEAALESYRAKKPDLVIIDIGLPDANGLDLCKSMGLGGEGGVPFLFLTARGDLQTRVDCFRAGACDYIQKPFAIEELMARVNVHLRIKKSHDDLIQRNYELEVRARLRQDLTDMLAHDLKTPITSIKGTLDLIKMHGLISDARYDVIVDQAEAAADFMLLMLNDLLDVGQAEQVGLKPDIGTVQPASIVCKIESLFASRFKARGAKLECRVSDQLKSVKTDPNLLFRILVNLVSNAMKVTKSGKSVEVDCAKRNGGVRITVSDRGPGVPDAEKKRIFEKYTTIARGPAQKDGSGIGLTFCRYAAEALKGKVWVEDRPGGGSVFVLEA